MSDTHVYDSRPIVRTVRGTHTIRLKRTFGSKRCNNFELEPQSKKSANFRRQTASLGRLSLAWVLPVVARSPSARLQCLMQCCVTTAAAATAVQPIGHGHSPQSSGCLGQLDLPRTQRCCTVTSRHIAPSARVTHVRSETES